MKIEHSFLHILERLELEGNLRSLPQIEQQKRFVYVNGNKMINLSSNDYLGIASDEYMHREFLQQLQIEKLSFSSSSSRLLTGNSPEYMALEQLLASSFRKESALVFTSGYHMNVGILPAITDKSTLILADKLVHASLIDGIRLSEARCIRYRHQDYVQLEQLLKKYHGTFSRIIIVTESIFSMDGDVARLDILSDFKRHYPGVMLYVDEAHAVGVRGETGLGVAEEQGCMGDIDFLCGTFGKALASIGAYVVCTKVLHDFLVNRMRTLIFTTALPPINVAWTHFVFERLSDMKLKRERLGMLSHCLCDALKKRGYPCSSKSQIVPVLVGDSHAAVIKAEEMQRKGFYVLPVRPPTVPEGTSRLRISLCADIDGLDNLIDML